MQVRTAATNFLAAAILAVALPAALAGCGDGAPAQREGVSRPAHPPATVEAMNLAVGLMGKFEFEAAARAFGELAAAPGAPIEARLNAAIATLNQSREGAQEEAITSLRAILKDNPPAPIARRARYCLALSELYLGRPAEAAPHFTEVAATEGADAYAQYFAAQSLEQIGDAKGALGWYERAAERDPMLKSAELGIQRCARKLGDDARADRALAAFEALAANPRARAAEFKYTRMGALGLAVVLEGPNEPYAPPTGPVFAEPVPLAVEFPAGAAGSWSSDSAQFATTVDLNHDGALDIVLARGAADARTLVLEAKPGADGYIARPDHPLAAILGAQVNSLLWGDIDGNGRVDAFACASGGNRLALQAPDGTFRDATAEWGAVGPAATCIDGALADLDHDGDLDVFLLYRDAPNELLANTGAGAFRPIAAEAGLATADRLPFAVIVSDFDYDRDADILVLNENQTNELFLNDRLWKWRPGLAPGVSREQLEERATAAAVIEIADLPLRRLVLGGNGFIRLPSRVEPAEAVRFGEFAAADVTGDGRQDLVECASDRIVLRGESAKILATLPVPQGVVRTQVVTIDPTRGPSLLSLRAGAGPLVWAPGPGRGAYTAVSFAGRDDPSQSMRSNTSGIGTSYAARVGSEWFGGETFRNHAGRGQSLAPVSIGLGPFTKADLLEVEWSDGVFQSEIDLVAAKRHDLTETQRQISSCPVLFAWNGRGLSFVSDVLGVGGVGYLLSPGTYSEPRPRETFVMPADALVPRPDGTLSIALAEPMEESCLLDAVRLLAIDLPAGWDIAPDERLAIGGPAPTGGLVAWSSEWLPIGSATLSNADQLALDSGPADTRFLGLLRTEQVVEIAFETPIDAVSDPWLVIDGWVEYPYCQTMFAAWQAGVAYRAPNLEARATDGTWVELSGEWGYPAGMPRRMALPIPREKLPAGATHLRMRTNMEVYFDSIRLVEREALPQEPVVCSVARATLASPGFARRTTGPQKQPFYDRSAMLPLWDCRFQRGLYTEFGDVRALLSREDGAPVVFGPGEEVAIDFAPPTDAPRPGTTRRYVLDARGWCKDMDLFTRDGETIDPLPGEPVDREAAALLKATRTRPAGGR